MKEEMSRQLKKFKALIAENKISTFDLKFVDLTGSFRHVSIPKNSFSDLILTEGIGFDGSSVEFKSVKSGDMCLIPDLGTVFWDPFWDQPTLSMFCNVVEADTREEFIGDPRSITIRASKYLQESGVAHTAYVLPEFEFNIFDSVSFSIDSENSFFRVQSRESKKESDKSDSPLLGYWIPHQGGYHSAAPGDAYRNIRAEIVQTLENMGIKVKYHHHEVGSAGQQEIELTPEKMITACDNGMLLKYTVKNILLNHGLSATFMPKPIVGEAGNGMHMHFRLEDSNQQPLFYDNKDNMGLSELAYCFIGGIIHHARSLAAFTNPSTSSYKRLIKGFEAPTNLFFSLGSRKASIRIPKYATTPNSKRFEIRSPDATSNFYFATAAIIMAGIDGVEKGIHAREMKWGPYNEIEHAPKRVRRNILSMPETLEEALIALDKDHEYLVKGNVFTETLIKGWQKSKYEREVVPMKNSPTPLEFALYYNC